MSDEESRNSWGDDALLPPDPTYAGLRIQDSGLSLRPDFALGVAHRSARIALSLLALLALVLGINLVGATNRFVTAWDAYDRLGMELNRFQYTDPDTPVRTLFVLSNPSDVMIQVLEIELRLNAGVHRVGGSQIRPSNDPEAATGDITEKYRLEPGETQAFAIDLAISDTDYVRRLGTDAIDWRMQGRIQVLADEEMRPLWIPFTVRYLPQ